MAVEIHRSGALDDAVAEALAADPDLELEAGNEFAVSGTLRINMVLSDPDGSHLLQCDWVEATASAPEVPIEQPEQPPA